MRTEPKPQRVTDSQGSAERDDFLALKLYLGATAVGVAVGVVVGAMGFAADPVGIGRWAYYGGMSAAALVGSPVLFAVFSGFLPRPSGRAVVLTLYPMVVGIAGFTGLVLGTIGPRDLRPPKYLGLITFPPTPIGLSVYGALTLATLLGVLLAGVVFVSRRYVDPGPDAGTDAEADPGPEAEAGTDRDG